MSKSFLNLNKSLHLSGVKIKIFLVACLVFILSTKVKRFISEEVKCSFNKLKYSLINALDGTTITTSLSFSSINFLKTNDFPVLVGAEKLKYLLL